MKGGCHDERYDGSGMMWGMVLAAIVGIIVIVLVIAALIKYVFFR